ncbi:MAG: glycoside hydrolase family 38 C-terminal domain-containing protein [Sphaerochaetaceae bacterium]|nr:glycoside hydrolase family 38 C-terminal domain-containing protein [Sphaerochaetaceae bacterium]
MNRKENTKSAVYLIGNAHLDICWLWDYEDGFQEVRATFRSAIDRINEYKEHVFSSASSAHYEMVLNSDPSLFQEIKIAVKSGRWHIVGGWYLQPDCNAPSGESFVRQGLYAQQFFLEHFGVMATSGYNVDSFGHNANLPQILSKQNMDSYVFMRPSPEECRENKEFLFKWKGIDGTSVTASRVPISYTAVDAWGTKLIKKLNEIIQLSETEEKPVMCFFGIGNHGGGPTKENLEVLHHAISSNETEVPIVHGSTRDYFDYIAKKDIRIPEYQGELQHHAIGCYSLMADIKYLNNQCENRLLRAEKFSATFGNIVDLDYDFKKFEDNWKKVLFNQFHDILGGCCAPSVHAGVIHRYGHVLNDVREIENLIIQRIGSGLDTSDGDMCLLVLNSHPWEVIETVNLECLVENIIDKEGNEIPFQFVKSVPTSGFYAYNTKVTLTVPALGYATWKLIGVHALMDPENFSTLGQLKVPSRIIGNESLSVSLDSEKREIGEIRKDGKIILKGIRPVVIDDPSDAWSHGLVSYDGMRTYLQITDVKVFSTGPVFEEYELIYMYGSSTLKLRVNVDFVRNAIEIKCDIFWAEKQKMLKLVFDTEESREFYSEIPYGWIKRNSDKTEYPCQRWISKSLSGGTYVGIINDGIYSCSSSFSTLEYGLLRSPGAAHHEPAVLGDTSFHRYTDQGFFNCSFLIKDGKENSCFTKEAVQFNQQPISLVESTHKGILPSSKTILDLDIDGVVVTAFKKAESRKGWIFRAVETRGEHHVEKLIIGDTSESIEFKPFEIKSIFISDDYYTIRETDLLEKSY